MKHQQNNKKIEECAKRLLISYFKQRRYDGNGKEKPGKQSDW